MTNDDLKQIDKLLVKRFTAQDKKFDKRFEAQDKRFDAIDQRFEAVDQRFNDQDKKFETILEKRLISQKEEIVEEIAAFMNENLFPYLDKLAHKSDVERIERRLDAMSNQVGDHEVRIEDIERVPVVAHQLKVNKKN